MFHVDNGGYDLAYVAEGLGGDVGEVVGHRVPVRGKRAGGGVGTLDDVNCGDAEAVDVEVIVSYGALHFIDEAADTEALSNGPDAGIELRREVLRDVFAAEFGVAAADHVEEDAADRPISCW